MLAFVTQGLNNIIKMLYENQIYVCLYVLFVILVLFWSSSCKLLIILAFSTNICIMVIFRKYIISFLVVPNQGMNSLIDSNTLFLLFPKWWNLCSCLKVIPFLYHSILYCISILCDLCVPNVP